MRSKLAETDRLRARYNLACGYANQALAPPTAQSQDELSRWTLQKADHHARLLLVSVLEHRGQHDCPQQLRLLADNIRDPAVILLAGIWAEDRRIGDRPPLPEETPATELAPEDVLLAEMLRKPTPHTRLIEVLGVEPGQGNARLAYNFACYYATVGDDEHLDLAISAVALAVADPAIRSWAPLDPWLAPLQEHSRWRELFPSDAAEKPEPGLGWGEAIGAIGLDAVPVAFGRPERSPDETDLVFKGQLPTRWRPGEVQLTIRADRFPLAQVVIPSPLRELIRAFWLRADGVDVMLRRIDLGLEDDPRLVFIGELSGPPPSWADLRAWMVVVP